MNDDTHPDDTDEADIDSFALYAGDSHRAHLFDDDYQLHVTITLELPGGWGANTLPLTAAAEVLDQLERDGLRPYRTIIKIVEKPTT
jgi:hypothetical protein